MSQSTTTASGAAKPARDTKGVDTPLPRPTRRQRVGAVDLQSVDVRRLIPLAFLSPADLERSLDGLQPPAFTVDRILKDGLPLAWP